MDRGKFSSPIIIYSIELFLCLLPEYCNCYSLIMMFLFANLIQWTCTMKIRLHFILCSDHVKAHRHSLMQIDWWAGSSTFDLAWTFIHRNFSWTIVCFLPSSCSRRAVFSCSNQVLLFVLGFYCPVNPLGSCRAWSIYLTTLLLDGLCPLSG